MNFLKNLSPAWLLPLTALFTSVMIAYRVYTNGDSNFLPFYLLLLLGAIIFTSILLIEYIVLWDLMLESERDYILDRVDVLWYPFGLLVAIIAFSEYDRNNYINYQQYFLDTIQETINNYTNNLSPTNINYWCDDINKKISIGDGLRVSSDITRHYNICNIISEYSYKINENIRENLPINGDEIVDYMNLIYNECGDRLFMSDVTLFIQEREGVIFNVEYKLDHSDFEKTVHQYFVLHAYPVSNTLNIGQISVLKGIEENPINGICSITKFMLFASKEISKYDYSVEKSIRENYAIWVSILSFFVGLKVLKTVNSIKK